MFFTDIPAQIEIKELLQKEVQSGKISHAKLFFGKSGYGSLALAHAYIAYLFCRDKAGKSEACGVCDSCIKLKKYAHPDVHYSYPLVLPISKTAEGYIEQWRSINTKSQFFNVKNWLATIDDKMRTPQIGTDEAHNIIKKLSLKSYEGEYKVMLIWMAEYMNHVAANNLLKLLEEPPPKTIFILIAENTDQLLPTVLSRTMRYNIPAFEKEEIERQLIEKNGVDSKEADIISSLSRGDLSIALDMLNTPSEMTALHQKFVAWMRMCYAKKVVDMIAFSNAIGAEGKEEQITILNYTLHLLRNAIVGNYHSALRSVSSEEEDFLKNFSKFITGNNIQGFLKEFSSAIYHIERNANGKVLFLDLSFNIMRFLHNH